MMRTRITDESAQVVFHLYLDKAERTAAAKLDKVWRSIESALASQDTYDEDIWAQYFEQAFGDFLHGTWDELLEAAALRAHQYMVKMILGRKALLDAWQFEGGKEAVRSWITERSFDTLKNATALQRKTLKREFYYHAVFRGKPEGAVASQIAKVIGLLPQQQRVLEKMREQMRAEGADQRTVKNAAERYRRYAKKQRGLMIARTEIAEAYHVGQVETVRAAADRGLILKVEKTWHTSEDERVCPICGPLNNTVVGLNDLFAGQYLHPPAHPRCRCDASYSSEI